MESGVESECEDVVAVRLGARRMYLTSPALRVLSPLREKRQIRKGSIVFARVDYACTCLEFALGSSVDLSA